MARDLVKLFPELTGLFGTKELMAHVTRLESWLASDPRKLTVPQRKHSRGFWNTVLMSRVTGGDMAVASLWRLWIIEQGLVQAKRAGKEKKFRSTLSADEEGFHQALAELFVIGALCPGFATVDLERPGSKKGKNYDVHLERPSNEIHLDVKWRTETPVGEASADLDANLKDLVGKDLDRTVYVKLRQNRPCDGDQLRLACIVVDALAMLRSGSAGAGLSTASLPPLSDRLRAHALHILYLGDPVHIVSLGGLDALYVPSEGVFLFDDEVVDSLEVGEDDPIIVLIPRGETRSVFSKEARERFGGVPRRVPFDYENPESAGVAGLLDEVYNQLPLAPTNLVGLGLFDPWAFEDAEYALVGEPDVTGARIGGLFELTSFAAIGGVIAFSLTPPGHDGTVLDVQTRFFANPNASNKPDPKVVEELEKRLRDHGKAAHSNALTLK